jgi:hypothetical protein
MNVGTSLLSPIVRRRGWTLSYSLWQGVVIALLVASAAAEAPCASGPSGIYVNKKSTYERIEFLPNGECFFHHASGAFPGSYAPEQDTFVCQRADEEKTLRFRFNGKVLVELDGSDWVPREEVAKTPWNDLWPVTMVVLDVASRREGPAAGFATLCLSPSHNRLKRSAHPVGLCWGEVVLHGPLDGRLCVRTGQSRAPQASARSSHRGTRGVWHARIATR